MTTIYVRKTHAGSTSRGRVWPADGAVLELPSEEAGDLLAIPDGGFSVLSPEETAAHLDRLAAQLAEAAKVAGEIAQVALTPSPAGDDTPEPAQGASAPPVAPKPRRRRAPRSTTTPRE